MKFSSLAVLEVVRMTTSSAASDEKFHQNDNISVSVLAALKDPIKFWIYTMTASEFVAWGVSSAAACWWGPFPGLNGQPGLCFRWPQFLLVGYGTGQAPQVDSKSQENLYIEPKIISIAWHKIAVTPVLYQGSYHTISARLWL